MRREIIHGGQTPRCVGKKRPQDARTVFTLFCSVLRVEFVVAKEGEKKKGSLYRGGGGAVNNIDEKTQR